MIKVKSVFHCSFYSQQNQVKILISYGSSQSYMEQLIFSTENILLKKANFMSSTICSLLHQALAIFYLDRYPFPDISILVRYKNIASALQQLISNLIALSLRRLMLYFSKSSLNFAIFIKYKIINYQFRVKHLHIF